MLYIERQNCGQKKITDLLVSCMWQLFNRGSNSKTVFSEKHLFSWWVQFQRSRTVAQFKSQQLWTINCTRQDAGSEQHSWYSHGRHVCKNCVLSYSVNTDMPVVFSNIVLVRKTAGDKEVLTNAFMDQVSSTSLCDSHLLQHLQLQGKFHFH